MTGFSLENFGSQQRESYSYQIVAVQPDGNAFKARRDDGKEVTFTKTRWNELKKDNKVKILTPTTFKVAVDPDFKPQNNWVNINV